MSALGPKPTFKFSIHISQSPTPPLPDLHSLWQLLLLLGSCTNSNLHCFPHLEPLPSPMAPGTCSLSCPFVLPWPSQSPSPSRIFTVLAPSWLSRVPNTAGHHVYPTPTSGTPSVLLHLGSLWSLAPSHKMDSLHSSEPKSTARFSLTPYSCPLDITTDSHIPYAKKCPNVPVSWPFS